MSAISYLWENQAAASGFRTGVSLHSHTNQSRETLDFIASFGNRFPAARALMSRLERASRKNYSIPVAYSSGYWTPPMTPRLAFDLESRQIQKLDLAPLVSITDHDTIQAPMLLRTVASARHIPVSVEWTAPFGGDQAFHLGIHNLPSEAGAEWMAAFAEYTASPDDRRLTEMLSALHALPNVLIVFNHPMWDLYLIGQQKHEQRVQEFLERNGEFVHALELNGLRHWEENRSVRRLARGWSKPLLSGGDRHGVEPNANINLTQAGSFTEFVHEVRYQGISNVLFLPQYAEPWKHRILRSTLDAIRYYPDFPEGSRRWDERVFHPDRQGVVRPLAQIWRRGQVPPTIRCAIAAILMMEHRPVASSLRLAWSESHQLRFGLEEAL